MKRALAIAIALAGCRSEGGVEFSYTIYRNGLTTPEASCASAGISTIRLMLGNDLDASNSLSDDELEGRAIADCNQIAGGTGHFTTPSDRLPSGDYNMFAIEAAAGFANVAYHPAMETSFTERWNYSRGDGAPIVVIQDGAMASISFESFAGGSADLHIIIR